MDRNMDAGSLGFGGESVYSSIFVVPWYGRDAVTVPKVLGCDTLNQSRV
jgi:hypothetical protein